MKVYFTLCLIYFLSPGAFSQTITPTGPTGFCPGGNILLTASNGDTYQWKINGADIAGATNKTYTASTAATYSVVITTNTIAATSPGVVVTSSNPVPSFTTPVGTLCGSDPVAFTSSISGGQAPYTFAWSFGGGGTANTTNPSHTFSVAGCGTSTVFNILTVTDANGCTGTITKPVSLLQGPDIQLQDQNQFSPFSNCENNPGPGNPNYTITVNNISPGTCITGYTLYWGDGSAVLTGLSAGSFPLTHTYTSLGAFNLIFSGTGTNGCKNSRRYVVANQSNPDIGIATTGVTEGCADLPVNILVSYWQLNSPGTTYLLEYGDGTTKQMTHPINSTNSDEAIVYTYKTTSCPNRSDYPLTISAINACRTKVFTGGNIVVKTKPKPDFSIGTHPACAGQPVCFNNETIAGYYNNCSTNTVYAWDFGDPASGANNTSAAGSPCHNYTMPGSYTVSLTTSNPCGTATTTKEVCINPSATPSFTIDDDNICTGTTVNTTNGSSIGNCVSAGYQWSVNYTAGFCGTTAGWNYTNGSSSSSTTPSFLFTNPGTYTIRLAITGACGNGSTQKIITVKQKPVVSLQPIANVCGQAVICPVATISTCTADPVVYAWEFDGGTPAISAAADPGCISFSTPGLHTIKLTVTNECGPTTVTQQFSNNTGADLTVPGPALYCGGDHAGPFNFTAIPSGAVITWTNSHPTIGIPASGNGNIPSFTASNTSGANITATISVTATLNGCPVTKDFTVTVNNEPAVPVVTSPVNYCTGDPSVPLTASLSPGHTLQWFTTATGGTADPVLPTPSTTNPGTTTYFISQINTATGCESKRVAIVVNVSLVPVVTGSSSVNPSTCASATGSITLTGLTPSYSFTLSYSKNGAPPAILTLTSGGSGVISITGLTAGIYSNIIVINNGCNSNSTGPITLVDPNPPAMPTTGNNVEVCEGLNIALTASSSLNNINWNWNGPAGFTSTVQNPVIPSSLPSYSGTYSVTVTQNNCTSPAAAVEVVVYPRPAAPILPANFSVCLKEDIHLQATSSFAGAVSWSWTGPDGFSSSDQNPVIPAATTAMNGLYQVQVTSSAGVCISAAAATTVSILPIPVIAGSSFINPVGCNSFTGSILLNGLLPSTLYQVRYTRNGNLQGSGTVSSAPDGTIIIGGLQAGNYTNVTVSLNTCISDVAGPFILEDTPPFSVVAATNGERCEGSTLLLTSRATSPGAALYAWTGPAGFTSTQQNPIINNAGVANSGVYEVTVTINACSARSSVTASVAEPTIGGNTSPDALVCPEKNNGTISLSGFRGNVIRWEFSINNGQSWDLIANTSSGLSYHNVTVNTLYRAIVQSGVCPPEFSGVTRVAVLAGIKQVTLQPQFVATCNHDTAITFTSAAVNEGSGTIQYYWYVNGQVAGTTNPYTHQFSSPLNNPSAEEFEVYAVVENSNGCSDRSLAGKIILHALPTPQIEVSPSALQREPNYTFVFTDVSPEGTADLYTWDVGDLNTATKSGRAITYDYKRPGTFRITLFAEDKNTGCTALDSVNVTIVPVPGLLQVPNAFYPGSSHPELRTFKLKGTGIKKFRLQIFDAWGKVVFETTALNADGSIKESWNGTYMNTGRPLPQDAYMWKVVEIAFENGRPWPGMSHNGGTAKYFGNLTLFR